MRDIARAGFPRCDLRESTRRSFVGCFGAPFERGRKDVNGTRPKDILHVLPKSEHRYIGRQVNQMRLDLLMGVAGEPEFRTR